MVQEEKHFRKIDFEFLQCSNCLKKANEDMNKMSFKDTCLIKEPTCENFTLAEIYQGHLCVCDLNGNMEFELELSTLHASLISVNIDRTSSGSIYWQ